MALESLPFWEVMILTILPITVGIMIFVRILDLFRAIYKKYKEYEEVIIDEIGSLLVFITIFYVIIQVILYMLGELPSGFSIFEFLIEDMLPLTIYVILLYGVLVQLKMLLTKWRARG